MLSTLRRQKQSFLRLIDEKADMVVPSTINGKLDRSLLHLPSQQLNTAAEKSKRSQVNRGAAANIVNPDKRETVIVDVREFRNSTSLPLMLHREHMNVVPVTLKVGDYILSPQVCVERKCISDLFSSTLHGRLYDQILQITRYYQVPILLIEFDEKKPFSLQNMKDIPHTISLSNIISKLSILTIHFSGLSILWSRCPQVTTKLFRALKNNRAQPNVDMAITISDSTGDDENDDNDDQHTPKDVLRSLPGVSYRNVDKILAKCTSLKDLCSKNKEQVYDMLGVKDGKLLYEFLHTNYFND